MSGGRPLRRPRHGGSAGLLLALAVTVSACGGGPAPRSAGDTLRVVATTTVLADLVRQVGGADVTVTSMVPKGGEVHTFDPSPSDLRAVASADLIFMNGLGLDDWLGDAVTDSGSSAPVIALGEDLSGVTYQPVDPEPGEPVNPHLWLDAGYAARYVERIVETLAPIEGERSARIRAGGDAYLQRLADLDGWALARIAEIPEEDRVIVSFHEAFPYFAEAYGLTIAGIIVGAPGQDPSAGEIARLVDAIRASGARAVFGEAQFSPDLARTVADEAGIPVVTDLYSDTLGDPPVDSYEGMIRWDVDRVVDALDG